MPYVIGEITHNPSKCPHTVAERGERERERERALLKFKVIDLSAG